MLHYTPIEPEHMPTITIPQQCDVTDDKNPTYHVWQDCPKSVTETTFVPNTVATFSWPDSIVKKGDKSFWKVTIDNKNYLIPVVPPMP